ncbi:MAG TPA: leucyl aminopeptidase [Candidatus Babeliales bacterium]|nr:leucyl aminopeptidase [Candidatus Babeliales bacterium]
MISIIKNTKSIVEQNVDAIVVFVPENFLYEDVQPIAEKYFSALQDLMMKKKFTGKALSTCVVTGENGSQSVDLVFIGLGKPGKTGAIDIETYRRAVGRAVRIAETRNTTSMAFQLPHGALFNDTAYAVAYHTTTITYIAAYHFNEFITDADQKQDTLKQVVFVTDHADAEIVEAMNAGAVVGQSVNQTRHWIDMPPSHLTPTHLANKAEAIANKHGLKLTIFSENEVRQMGMGGLAGVSRGSDNDCKLVILEYTCSKKDAETIAFVGKGITFDSGGLSIKPADYMEKMKDDMAGAAAVINAIEALAILKPDVNVIAIAPLAENLPSGKALMPGDIVTFYNGKTAEVRNTDAEGRLILADALSYAVKHYKPDAMIDLATLTGACAYALGPFYTGLMSAHDEFTERVTAAAESSGDRVWRLPFHDDYKAAIKNPLADICNIGSNRYRAGAITAGLFLQNFVEDVPWVHLDIAGTAFDVPDISYYRFDSATGVGVRLLVDLAMNWNVKKS